jgi:hypothetical protein
LRDRPSIGFCNEFLLGSKYAGCLCNALKQVCAIRATEAVGVIEV